MGRKERRPANRPLQIAVMMLVALTAGTRLPAEVLRVVSADAGGWLAEVDSGSLSGFAGSDFVEALYSPVAFDTLSVTMDNGPAEAWEIWVKAAGSFWHPVLKIALKITSTGSGEGEAAAETGFLTLGSSCRLLISGTGSRTGITIQYRIGGLSAAVVPADDYAVDILYTLKVNGAT